MSFRQKCIRKGHKFKVAALSPVPYIWCSRKRCDAITVADWVPELIGRSLHNALPEDKRDPSGQR